MRLHPALLLLAAGCGPRVTTAVAPAADVRRLTMPELTALYEADEFRADGSLTGRTLEITGVVETVFPDRHLGFDFTLFPSRRADARPLHPAEYRLSGVGCALSPGGRAGAAGLAAGSPVTVRGLYRGRAPARTGRLEDAALVAPWSLERLVPQDDE